MSFKENTTVIVDYDSSILSQTDNFFWRPRNIDRIPLPVLNPLIVFGVNANPSEYSERTGLRIAFRVNDPGMPIYLSGANFLDRPIVTTDYNHAQIADNLKALLTRYKGYPFVASVFSSFHSEDDVIGGLRISGWIGDSTSVDQSFFHVNIETSLGSIPAALTPAQAALSAENFSSSRPLTQDEIALIPEWIQPIQITGESSIVTFANGNNYLNDAGTQTESPPDGRGRTMAILENAYIITSPGRIDSDGVVQDAVQGDVATGSLKLNVALSPERPSYTSSTTAMILSSAYTSDIRNPSDDEIIQRGSHNLTIRINDKGSIGLNEVPLDIAQKFSPPIMINGQQFFIEQVQETSTNSIILNLIDVVQ